MEAREDVCLRVAGRGALELEVMILDLLRRMEDGAREDGGMAGKVSGLIFISVGCWR